MLDICPFLLYHELDAPFYGTNLCQVQITASVRKAHKQTWQYAFPLNQSKAVVHDSEVCARGHHVITGTRRLTHFVM